LAKSRFFWSMPLALFSLEIYLGVLMGYFTAKLLSGEEPGIPGKVKSLRFGIGKYQLHLHHWVICLGILISGLTLKFFPFSPQLSCGILGGVIFQGITCYPDWYKILSKQKYD